MVEVFRDIDGYEGLYQISNLGNVKSLKWGKERILKPIINTYGYEFVHLSINNKSKCCLIHTLVAQAFLPNPQGLNEINHKDENITNNCVDNLEYCTHTYNINYGTRNKRVAKKQINDPKKSKPILCIELNKIFPSAAEAKRLLNVNPTSIWKCCNGIYNKAGNYQWRYV